MQRWLRVDINDSHLCHGFKCQVLPQKNKNPIPYSIKHLKSNEEGSPELWLWPPLWVRHSICARTLFGAVMDVVTTTGKNEWSLWNYGKLSSSDWKPMRLAFLSGDLTPISGSVAPQVTSWTMPPAATAVLAKGKKSYWKDYQKINTAGSKMINLGSTYKNK